MKYVRLTLLWCLAFSGTSLLVSALDPLGLFAETQTGGATIYPTLRFYRGGAHSSVTESTLTRVFEDRLTGATDKASLTKPLAKHLYRLCLEYQLDPAFVLSLIQVESGFRTDAVSPSGAVGLMQLMPDTARVLVRNSPSLRAKLTARNAAQALRDPFLNLTLGVRYLKQLQNRYAGLSPYFHLAAYNMGPYRLDTLRAKPSFRPEKTLKYYQDVMRGVSDWRYYRGRELGVKSGASQRKVTIQSGRSALEPISDVHSKPLS